MELETVEELKISSTEKISFSLMMEDSLLFGVKIQRLSLDDNENWKPEKKSLILDVECTSRLLRIISGIDSVFAISQKEIDDQNADMEEVKNKLAVERVRRNMLDVDLNE